MSPTCELEEDGKPTVYVEAEALRHKSFFYNFLQGIVCYFDDRFSFCFNLKHTEKVFNLLVEVGTSTIKRMSSFLLDTKKRKR